MSRSALPSPVYIIKKYPHDGIPKYNEIPFEILTLATKDH